MADLRTPPPSVGFNHNLSYQGRVFHVQTEDSGLPHAHVLTHLFLGGNVVVTHRSSYAHLVHSSDLPSTVRRLMEEQHKTMMRGLLRGEFDGAIEKRVGARVYEPGVLAGGLRAPELLVGGATPRPARPGDSRPPVLTPQPAAHTPAPSTGSPLFDGPMDDPPLDVLVLKFLASRERDG